MFTSEQRVAAVYKQEVGTEIQRLLPELSISNQRALSTHLFHDRFTYTPDRQSTIPSAERIVNWATMAHPLVTISGPAGCGKSTLAWQIMTEADARGKAAILVSAPDLVVRKDLERNSGDEQLPYSSIKTVDSILSKLEKLARRGQPLGNQVVIIVDGIDLVSYNPNEIVGGRNFLDRIHSLSMRPILMVESDHSQLTSPTIKSYHQILNPDGLPSLGIIIRSDGSNRSIEPRDIAQSR